MSQVSRTAACACGAVSVAATGEPSRNLLCSCSDCRRLAGTAFNWSCYWPEEAVKTTGTVRSFRRASQGDRSLTYSFCPTCGTTMWWHADFAPAMIGLPGAGFQGPPIARPDQAYWTEGRPDWALHLSQIPGKERQ